MKIATILLLAASGFSAAGCTGLEFLEQIPTPPQPVPTVTLEIGSVSVKSGFVVDVPIWIMSLTSQMRLVIGAETFDENGACRGQLLGNDITAADIAPVSGETLGLSYNPRILKVVGGASDARWRICIIADNSSGRVDIDAFLQPGEAVLGRQVLMNLRFLAKGQGISVLTIDPGRVKAWIAQNTRVLVAVQEGQIEVR